MSPWLFPRKKEFYDYFLEAGENADRAAETLVKMADALENSETFASQIREYEHRGDEITHHTIRMLNMTFVTPIDREDIYRLIAEMDDIVDFTEAVSERLWLYKLRGQNPALKELAGILKESTARVVEALRALKEPRLRRKVLEILEKIHYLENQGDQSLRSALSSLFENNPNPLEVIKWKEIYENAEMAIDKCENVASIIESILVKYG
ncbi:MAG: DUF47 domain-containing protein [bacterium JZ-2024 1]